MPPRSIKLPTISNKNRQRVIGIFGTCLGLFGLLFGMFWDRMFNTILEKNLILQPNSELYDLWQSPPVKTVLDIYLFNWTNPEDFMDPSIKPILQELGPYRFIESSEKENIQWNTQNATVSFRKKSFYHFDATGSRGSLSDHIITINSLLVSAITQGKRFSPMRRSFTEMAMLSYPSDLTLRKTADELLFRGVDDAFLSMANKLPTSISDVKVPFEKYGYFYGRNGSSDFLGNFNMHTGADDISNLGKMHSWQYKTSTKGYPRSCSDVRGSAGEFQGPDMPVNGTVNIFLPELCRDLPFEYDGQVDVHGVTGYRYIGGPRSVDNGTLYPENKCYCNGDCAPSGVLNITACVYDSPFFISYPHFYNADPYYLDQVEGMNPQKERHQFEYIIEPKTSIGIDMKGRTQVNLLVEPLPFSVILRKVRKVFFPLFWIESTTRLTPDLLEFFKPISTYVLCGRIFGAVCCLVGLVLAFWYPIVQYSNRRLLEHLEDVDFEHGTKDCVSAKNNILSRDTGIFVNTDKLSTVSS